MLGLFAAISNELHFWFTSLMSPLFFQPMQADSSGGAIPRDEQGAAGGTDP